MTTGTRKKAQASAPETLEKRIHTLFERAVARAQKQADLAMASANKWAIGSWQARQLDSAEAEIKNMSQDIEDLTPYGRQRLQELKAYRGRLRHEIASYQEPHECRANAILALLSQARRAAKTAGGQPDPRERLLGMCAAAERLREYLTPADAAALDGLKAGVEALEAEPEETEAEEDDSARVEALPVTEWEFESPPAEVFQSSSPNTFGAQPFAAYRLNRASQELSLVRGFDVLLTPQIAHGLVEYPHQIETARTVLRRMRGRALLCDEVGLGKTIEAAIIAREYVARGLVRRILVLAPPALVSQWREEMREKFDLEFVAHDDPEFRQRGAEAWGAFDRIIASIHTAKLAQHRKPLLEQEFDLIIVDEAHHLRSRASQGWKFVNELKKRYILLLTATPVQNDLDELFNLITLLSPGQLKTSSAFRREFVARGDPRTPRNRERLRQLMSEVMIRNTRSRVHIAMPPRIAATHRLAQSPEEAALYAAASDFTRRGVAEGTLDRMAAATLLREAGSSAPALARTLENMAGRRRGGRELRELAAAAREVKRHAKAEQLCSLLAKRSEKTVVFTFFRETLHLLEQSLDAAGISYASLSGEIGAADKDRAMAAFAADRRVLLSTDVGSEGRNIQFCHAVLNFDLPWNPMRIEQRVGRVHRIGQRHEVLIDNIAARHTIEDYILRILDEKLNMFELVVGEIGVILGNMETEQDFEELALDIWTAARSDTDVERGFAQLAEQLQEAQNRHRRAQEFDEALFGNELAAEDETEG